MHLGIWTLAMSTVHAGVMGEPTHDWTSFYLGGNVGGIWGQFSSPILIDPIRINTFSFGPFLEKFKVDKNSVTGGAQFGYNWQKEHWLYGAEFDINVQQLNGTYLLTDRTRSPFEPNDEFVTKNDSRASIRGRVGYATNNWLMYATGGIAFTHIEFNANYIQNTINNITYPASSGIDTHILVGGTVGLGVEYALSESFSVALEGLYSGYGSKDYELGSVAAFSLSTTTFVFVPTTGRLSMDSGELVLKANYHFDNSMWG